MAVTNKTLITAVFLLALTLLFFYFSPIALQDLGLSNDIANADSQSAYATAPGKAVLADNIPQQSEQQADALAGQAKAASALAVSNETPLQKFTDSWSLYLDKSSAKYKELLEKYAVSDDTIFVEGDTAYIKSETEEGIEFTRLTKEYRELARHQPFNVYGIFLQQLNELEGYGDWSYNAELTVRKLFSDYFSPGEYSINAMQCREKTCLIEFSFADFDKAASFIDGLRANRHKCRCIPAETMWPELMQAVVKIDLL